MKFSYLGAAAALVCAAALAACGGKAMFTVQGTITGLNNAGLVMANGSDTVKVPAGAASFALPTQIAYGTSFAVTVQTQPDHQTCNVDGYTNVGAAGHTAVINALVSCTQNTHTLGGQYTGLTAGTVILTNGTAGGTVTIGAPADNSGAGEFTFGTVVADGQAYGVTVLTQPDTLVCSVTNATGIMHENNVSNLLVNCVPK